MMRSPAFSSFFKSKCYVHGCDMRLTFLVDPRSVFGALKVYLDMGPDYFTSEKLAAYVEANYEAFEGFLFFAKLYSLSKKLMLEVLADNIHKCLLETEDLIEPAHWYQLAATIFAESSACDKVLKDWCWGHIKKNAPTIQRLEDWITIDQDSNLGVKWMELKVSIKRKELEEREEEERQAAARLEARWARREALALAYLDRNPQVADMYFGGVRTGREGLRGERGGGRQKTTVELLWELEERRRAERRGLLGFLGKALQRR